MLDIIERENLELVRYAVELHQNGHIQPGTYIVDLEALAENAVKVRDRASDLGLGVYVMTKQWNRNPAIGRTLAGEGLNSFVAVDVQCTIEIRRQELQLGHVGHLVQIPRHQIEQVLRMAPEVWTVYGYDNAVLVSRACERLGVQQDLLLKVVGPDDFVYPGQEGGVPLDRVVEVARRIGDLQGVRIVGTTGFPCVLYDPEKGSPQALPNLTSVTEAARMLEHEAGVEIRQVNCPGTSSCASMEIVKRQGGTQVEPGNSLWGMAPQQLFGGDAGTAAVVFVTEVSHIEEGGGSCSPGGSLPTSSSGRWPSERRSSVERRIQHSRTGSRQGSPSPAEPIIHGCIQARARASRQETARCSSSGRRSSRPVMPALRPSRASRRASRYWGLSTTKLIDPCQ